MEGFQKIGKLFHNFTVDINAYATDTLLKQLKGDLSNAFG